MEAADLARWTRFAAKGGIGKCTAIVDCVAENADDLMFLKEDEITVLMQLTEPQGVFLGYCEGVVGRFDGKNVRFHSKLKKPIMAKRSSVTSPGQHQTVSHTPSPLLQRDSPVPSLGPTRRARVSLDEEVSAAIRPILTSALPPSTEIAQMNMMAESSSTIPDTFCVSEPEVQALPSSHAEPHIAPPSKSPSLSSGTPPSPPSPEPAPTPPQHSMEERDTSSQELTARTPPLVSLSRPRRLRPTSSPSLPGSVTQQTPPRLSSESKRASIASAYSQVSTEVEHSADTIQRPRVVDSQAPAPQVVPPSTSADTSTSTYFDTSRLSLASSDGEVGIGLSLLQSLADNESNDEWSDSESDGPDMPRQHSVSGRGGGSLEHRESHMSKNGPALSRRSSTNSTPKKGASVSSLGSRGAVTTGNSSDLRNLDYGDTETGDDLFSGQQEGRDDDPIGALEADISQAQAQFANYKLSSSHKSSSHEQMTFPPVAPLSPSRNRTETYVFPAPPTHTHRGSIQSASRRSVSSIPPVRNLPDLDVDRRPSAVSNATSSSGNGEDWDGADDIYDDYRYSRFSVGGASSKASMVSRTSAGSRRVSTTSKMSVSSRSAVNPRPRVGSSGLADSTVGATDFPNPIAMSPPQFSREVSKVSRKSEESTWSTGSDGPPRPTRSTPNTSTGQQLRAFGPSVESSGEAESVAGAAARETRRKVSVDGSDSDGSVYTQSSMGKGSFPESQPPSSNPTSPTAGSFPSSSPRVTASPLPLRPLEPQTTPATQGTRPAPLNLTETTNRLTTSSTQSPLLHTTWSPQASPREAGSPAGGAPGYTGTGEGFTVERSRGIPASATYFPGAGTGGMDALSKVLAEAQRDKRGSLDLRVDDGVGNARRIVVEEEDDGDDDDVLIERSQSSHETGNVKVVEEGGSAILGSEVIETESVLSVALENQGSSSSSQASELNKAYNSFPSTTAPTVTSTVSAEPPPALAATPPPPSHLRPSLHELRGGQPSGERRSLFLPHPNAPKAPSAHSPGPMYIAQQQPRPSHPQQTHGTAVQAIRIALSGQGRGAFGRGPTIYGRTLSDLSSSTGPVLITFGVDAPSDPVPPPGTTSPHTTAAPLQMRGAAEPPVRSSLGGGSVGLPAIMATGAETPPSVDQAVGGVIPRANFFPQVGGVRPRSRSFSGFQSTDVEVPMPLQRSRLESSASDQIPTALEVRQSLSPPRPLSASRTPYVLPPIRSGSPLARIGPRRSPQPPPSPLAQSAFVETASAPPSPTALGHRAAGLRHISSRSKLSEATSPLTRMRAGTVSNLDLRGSAAISSTFLPSQEMPSPTQVQPSTPTEPTSPTIPKASSPTLLRQQSLRTKLSLPNLRRNASQHDEPPSAIPEQPIRENDTVQIKDMGFELVRPAIPQVQAPRSSEDSSILGRDGAVEPRRDVSLHGTNSPGLSAPHSPALLSDSNTQGSRMKSPVDSLRPSDSEQSMDAHRQREQKWMAVMGSTPPSQSRKSKKVKKLLLEGVPSSVQYLVWSHLMDGKARVVPGVYGQLGSRSRVPVFSDIDRDVQRYFTDQPQLRVPQGPIVSLLQAYLTMVPDIQYTTGLTLIAGHLLILAPEEDAFWIFVSIMDTHLRAYFGSSSAQIEVDSLLFSRALEIADPAVGKKVFVEFGISPVSLCRPWFTSLFVSCLPSNHLNRVWDLFLFEGVPFLLRVGLALVACTRRLLMESGSEDDVLRILTCPPPNILPPDGDTFIAVALSVKLKDDDVRKQRVKLEAQVKRQTQLPRPSGSISLPRI